MLDTIDLPSDCVISQMSESPLIYHLENFLTEAECDNLIEVAVPKMKRSVTVDPETGESFEIDQRTSSSAFFLVGENIPVNQVESKIARLLQRPPRFAEGLQILNYKIGQEYQPHFDYFDPKLKGSIRCMERGGQRVATLIMYLSNPEAGGETFFPDAKVSLFPKKRDGILFYNLHPNGSLDPLTLHGSRPITSGEKWAATKWIREKIY
ncbi:MAG: 2OG-Fe(II) oxygenase [Cyanobacteria bacterium]|nr:2OG-Fe(II) oxygenase [Cyanobacteriota bacterium]